MTLGIDMPAESFLPAAPIGSHRVTVSSLMYDGPGVGGWDLVGRVTYSHSIVAGGLELMSYTTRFTPETSLTILLEILASTS